MICLDHRFEFVDLLLLRLQPGILITQLFILTGQRLSLFSQCLGLLTQLFILIRQRLIFPDQVERQLDRKSVV